ncbi:hypothetical protein C2G38_2184971 [Gigaspora rosea]|uniref:Uncharacterized protein n=1 Tax=Gigaspora rosea TaxID=44941 RepID=A0A397V8A3_9GLOM|nr:hypothetical protein C2G38_2184971 [Gigaspora rosea]
MGHGSIFDKLKPKENLVRSWFIENYAHEFKFNENKKAFEFTPKDIKVYLKSRYESNTIKCSHELDVICKKYRILNAKIKVGLPWLSTFLGITHGTDIQKSNSIENFLNTLLKLGKKRKSLFLNHTSNQLAN